MSSSPTYLIVVMGVCGSGKSSVAGAICQRRKEEGDAVELLEADDFHSVENKERMASDLPTLFVHLDGSPEVISSRLAGRRGHFMDPGLLTSQFDTLERPDQDREPDAVAIDVAGGLDEVVAKAVEASDNFVQKLKKGKKI